jgi:peptide/nickel transport system substrate-binding protein
MAETKVTYFPKICRAIPRSICWADAGFVRRAKRDLRAADDSGPNGQGLFNLGSYSSKRVDELGKAIASELDQTKRNAMIAELFKIHGEEFGTLPLHQQALAWGVKKNIDLVNWPTTSTS